MTAYALGELAHRRGDSMDTNPFPAGSYDRTRWFSGWLMAKAVANSRGKIR